MTHRVFAAAFSVAVLCSPIARAQQLPPGGAKISATTAKQPAVPKNAKQMLTPTLMSFQCKDATPEAAVAQLEKELDLTLRSSFYSLSSAKGKVSCNETNQPYWKVMTDLCQQGDLYISTENASGPFAFVPKQRFSGYNSYFFSPTKIDSALMPALTDFNYGSKRVGDRSMADRERVQLRISLMSEPRVFVAAYNINVDITAAVDDKGQSLVLPASAQPHLVSKSNPLREYIGVARDTFAVAEVYVKGPLPPAKMIKRLTGSVRVVLGLEPRTVDLTPVLEGKEGRMPLGRNGDIVFTDLVRDDNEHGYKLSLSMPDKIPGMGFIADAVEFKSMRLVLTDEQGKNYRYEGVSRLNTLGNQVGGSARFWSSSGDASKRKPAKLTCTMATRLEEVTIPFEFADVTIPEPR